MVKARSLHQTQGEGRRAWALRRGKVAVCGREEWGRGRGIRACVFYWGDSATAPIPAGDTAIVVAVVMVGNGRCERRAGTLPRGELAKGLVRVVDVGVGIRYGEGFVAGGRCRRNAGGRWS